MNRTVALAILGVCFVAAGVMRVDAAGPETGRIGYINLNRTLLETDSGKKALKRLEADKNKKQGELSKKEQELQRFAAELEKQRVVLKPDVLKAKQQELQERYVALQQRMFELQRELSQSEAKAIQQIMVKAEPIIKKIAKQQGFSVIFERSNLVWAPDSADITAEVNKSL